MKKLSIFLFVAVMLTNACKQTPAPVSVDLNAVKATVDSMFDRFTSTWNNQDDSIMMSYLTEDALILGTDPSEFWTKKEFSDGWQQMAADSVPVFNFIGNREIKVSPDGNAAMVVEQFFMPGVSPKIPWRNVYQAVKVDGRWMIDFLSSSFIPRNDDITRINNAVE